jgi:hypothetical protein
LVGDWINDLPKRTRRHLTFIILALILRLVDAFFTDHITNGLEDSSFTKLVTDCVIDIALEVIDLLNSGNFGLIESV